MRLPRDVSGQRLADALRVLGYAPSRQRGDHLRLTTQQNWEHHVSIPLHDSQRIGTLSGVLTGVATHHALTRDELLQRLSLWSVLCALGSSFEPSNSQTLRKSCQQVGYSCEPSETSRVLLCIGVNRRQYLRREDGVAAYIGM